MNGYNEIFSRSIKEYAVEDADHRAAAFFSDEILEKTGCSLAEDETKDAGFVFCRRERIEELPETARIKLKKLEESGEEGFRLCLDCGCLYIEARDSRGLLYGAGKLLRKMWLEEGRIGIPETFSALSLTPGNRMRGHQLAYRDKNNTTCAWKTEDFERYIKDLMVFGANTIEILPPHTDDRLFSGHYPIAPKEMMKHLSEIIHELGLDVSMWYPYLSKEISGLPFEAEMAERREVFRELPYLDELLIPAGDPGELRPGDMFWAAKATADILHEYHPEAKIWIAPQIFEPDETWYEEFYSEVDKEPEWLYGVCFGSWVKDTIKEMYERLPGRYQDKIRHYPDISHNMNSQFEVPDWDPAFACTEGRESYNARPFGMKAIHAHHQPYVMGSVTYSEGIHDDFNKMIWGSLDFDSSEGAEEAVHEYVRFFIGPKYEAELCDLILHLEESWKGPILENETIDCQYQKAMELDSVLDTRTKENYRYQMLLLRVIGDHFVKERRRQDLIWEREAYEALKHMDTVGSKEAIKRATECLLKTYSEPVGEADRKKIQKLADSLYEKCRLQLTSFRHKGQATDRGAWLDTLMLPVNDAEYLINRFSQIRTIAREEERLEALRKLLEKYEPQKGTVYYNIGDFDGYSKVAKRIAWEDDPGNLRSPLLHHNSSLISMMNKKRFWYDQPPISRRWLSGARTIYGTALEIILENLDPEKHYIIELSYQQILLYDHIDMRFWAKDILIHETVERRMDDPWNPCYQYSLPCQAYTDGRLHLKWQTYRVEVPCVVSEIWLKELDESDGRE